jgi:serine/threonine protein kinase
VKKRIDAMTNKLGDLFTDFSRIDLDTRGGYARVAQVKTHGLGTTPELCAFKLMRHEIERNQGFERFDDELRLLIQIMNDSNAPRAITRIYSSGFAPVKLSECLHSREVPDSELDIIQTGIDTQLFFETKAILEEKEPGGWLPYLLVELAPYDDSLLRQIHQQPIKDLAGLYRLPTGEVIAMAFQLLEVMDYLHLKHRRAYIDWKPEHIYWNGREKKAKLIDWNVTIPLDDGPGERQNIHDDLRLFCGAVLYVSLTFTDPDDPSKPIGHRPTTELNAPVNEIRRRYSTDYPEFYQRAETLNDEIKKIIRHGLDPNQGFISTEELRLTLLEYAQRELGLQEYDVSSFETNTPYFTAINKMRLGQKYLLEAQEHLMEASKSGLNQTEFNQLFDQLKQALVNFPGS